MRTSLCAHSALRGASWVIKRDNIKSIETLTCLNSLKAVEPNRRGFKINEGQPTAKNEKGLELFNIL